jgi:hypothetical protein
MTKRVGILGLMAAAAVTLFTPAVASAQDRCDYHRYYGPAPVVYHDRYWREREWRQARERQIIREHEWRARQRYDRGPYYGYR